jgi:hypothetical protein
LKRNRPTLEGHRKDPVQLIRTAVTSFSGGATQQGLGQVSTLRLPGGAVKTHSSPYETLRRMPVGDV